MGEVAACVADAVADSDSGATLAVRRPTAAASGQDRAALEYRLRVDPLRQPFSAPARRLPEKGMHNMSGSTNQPPPSSNVSDVRVADIDAQLMCHSIAGTFAADCFAMSGGPRSRSVHGDGIYTPTNSGAGALTKPSVPTWNGAGQPGPGRAISRHRGHGRPVVHDLTRSERAARRLTGADERRDHR